MSSPENLNKGGPNPNAGAWNMDDVASQDAVKKMLEQQLGPDYEKNVKVQNVTVIKAAEKPKTTPKETTSTIPNVKELIGNAGFNAQPDNPRKHSIFIKYVESGQLSGEEYNRLDYLDDEIDSCDQILGNISLALSKNPDDEIRKEMEAERDYQHKLIMAKQNEYNELFNAISKRFNLDKRKQRMRESS